MLGLLRLLSGSVVAESQRQQELLEILVLRVRLLQQLVGLSRLETVQELGLVREILECFTVVFIARFRRVLTLDVIDTFTSHLLPILIFLVVAKDVGDLEGSHVSQICIQEGRFRANNGIHLSKGLHRTKVCKVDVRWHQIDVPEDEVGVEVDDTLHTNVGQVR